MNPAFRSLFVFELRLQFATPMAWIALIAFALVGFQLVIADPTPVNDVRIGLLHNGSSTFLIAFIGLSIPGLIVAGIFVGSGMLRDTSSRLSDLVHATAFPSPTYTIARLLACIAVVGSMFVAIGAGSLMGALSPWVTTDSIGPTPWTALALIVALYVGPNLLFVSATVFLLVAITRSLKYTVVGAVFIIILHSVANLVTGDHLYLASMIDPFGGQAAIAAMSSWNVIQLNAQIPYDSTVILNRVIWIAISGGMLAVGLRAMAKRPAEDFAEVNESNAADVPEQMVRVLTTNDFGHYSPARRSRRSELRKSVSLLHMEMEKIFLGTPFWLCSLILAGAVLVYLVFARSLDGTPVYPLTHYVLRAAQSAMAAVYPLIFGFFAGELVHSDRDKRVSQLTDAMPISHSAIAGSRIFAMVALVSALTSICVVAGCLFQLFDGSTTVDMELYAEGAVFIALPMLTFGVASLALQWLCVSKYTGYLLCAFLALIPLAMEEAGIQDHLAVFNSSAPVRYSDMGGFGPFAIPAIWFNVYWLSLSLAMAWIGSCFRLRGVYDAGARWKSAGSSMASRTFVFTLGIIFLVTLSSGAWIAWNTHVMNSIDSRSVVAERQIRYETFYRSYSDLSQPTLESVDIGVDIRPAARSVSFDAHYTIRNTTGSDISELAFTWDPRTQLTWGQGLTRARIDDRLAGFSVFILPSPLRPGDTISVAFNVEYQHHGFTNDGGDGDIVSDGTFVTSSLLPSIGYQKNMESGDLAERSRAGLKLGKPVVDPNASAVSGSNAPIVFHAVVSTDADQIGLAPGRLIKSWFASGRRFDEFRSEHKMINSYGFMSGRWEVKHSKIHGIDVYVYANSKHTWNIDSIVAAVNDGLDTYGSAYAPYDLTELRIAEFPEYRVFAQSFAGLIAYSGALGFTSRRGTGESMDFPYFITAHELAHQWWGHRLQPAAGPGSLFLSEGMAQYSAMVLLHEHRPATVASALAYLGRQYSEAAGINKAPEQSVDTVTDQKYVAYDKAGLVMERYRDAAGTGRAVQTIKEFFGEHSNATPPFVSASDLVQTLRQSLPAERRKAFDVWFTTSGPP